jgi:alginate O-acetyltransferase complex protein AlgF
MKPLLLFFSILSILCFSTLARAEDGNAALYDAAAPADSGFLRVLNLSSSLAEIMISGKSNSQKVAAGTLGPYLFTSPGSHTVKVNQSEIAITFDKKVAITLLYDGQTFTEVRDDVPDDAKKAAIAFYNFSGVPMALKTADGKHTIVDGIAPSKSGNRKVNEIKIQLSAFENSAKVADFDELFLRKGRSYSFVVAPANGTYKLISLANTVDSIE